MIGAVVLPSGPAGVDDGRMSARAAAGAGREFFGTPISEPEHPGEASLREWLDEQTGILGNTVTVEQAMGCVHAWLTSWQEAGGGIDCTEPLAELERK